VFVEGIRGATDAAAVGVTIATVVKSTTARRQAAMIEFNTASTFG
jgi:hypothetical protein